MSFSANVSKWANKTTDKLGLARNGALLKTFSAIIMDTPVGDPSEWRMSEQDRARAVADGYVGGRLRGNWICNEKFPIHAQLELEDASGRTATASMQNVIRRSSMGETIYFTNNMPYAARVEFEGWSHSQQPEGMMVKNVRRFNRLLDAEVRRLRRLP